MANVAVNDIYKVRAIGVIRNQIVENVRHYKITGTAGTSVTETVFLQAVRSTLETALLACISSTYTLTQWGGQLVDLFGVPQRIEVFTPSGNPGALSGDALPNLLTGVISLRSPVIGSKGRGRLYIPPANEASNDATGVPTATYLGLMGTLATALKATVNSGGGGNTATGEPGILSRRVQAFFFLAGTVTNTEWGTQRRRRIGAGR